MIKSSYAPNLSPLDRPQVHFISSLDVTLSLLMRKLSLEVSEESQAPTGGQGWAGGGMTREGRPESVKQRPPQGIWEPNFRKGVLDTLWGPFVSFP